MDSEEIKERYMAEYNKLVEKYENSDIRDTIEDLNKAIHTSDINRINEHYNKISVWNILVAHIEGARIPINVLYPYLHLPSPTIFSIILDENEKKWKFAAEIN